MTSAGWGGGVGSMKWHGQGDFAHAFMWPGRTGYLMKGGHIVSVEELLADASDEEAVYRSWLVFEGRLEFWDDSDDFEVRQGGRKVYRHSRDREVFALFSKQPVSP